MRWQVLDLVEDVEQYDREKPLVVAKNIGGREMAASVQSKLRLLKVGARTEHKNELEEKKKNGLNEGRRTALFLPQPCTRAINNNAVLTGKGYSAP